MDNPGKKLVRYLTLNHASLELGVVESTRGEGWVCVPAAIKLRTGLYSFKMGFPRSAPENGRPLCTEVRRSNRRIWSFEESVRPYVGLIHKTRVHLYEFGAKEDVVFCLVVVSEGDPDLLISVLRIDGTNFSDVLEGMFKTHIARLWGMRCQLTPAEQAELQKLLPKKRR